MGGGGGEYRPYHDKQNVSQYAMRQVTSITAFGSHMPLAASSSARELEARSMGTRRMMLIGRVRARKMGSRMYEGVVRRGR